MHIVLLRLVFTGEIVVVICIILSYIYPIFKILSSRVERSSESLFTSRAPKETLGIYLRKRRLNPQQNQPYQNKIKILTVGLIPGVNANYNDVIMAEMASQSTSLAIVYSAVWSGADQRIHQSFASLAFVWVIHRGPVNYPHKWPVTRKMFPFDDVFMTFTWRKASWPTSVNVIVYRLPGTKWTNVTHCYIRFLGANFNSIKIKNFIYFILKNAFENVVCKMSAILFRSQCLITAK